MEIEKIKSSYSYLYFLELSHPNQPRCNPDFTDLWNDGCEEYNDYQYCTISGDYGVGWNKTTDGVFDDYSKSNQTALVCPQCGCLERSIYRGELIINFLFFRVI